MVVTAMQLAIKKFKVIFPDTEIADLNKFSDKKVVLHAYNNSCIPQMDVCKVVLINKGIKFQSNFFVVLRNGPALLGILGCERYQLLTFKGDTRNADQNGIQVNEHTKKISSKQVKL